MRNWFRLVLVVGIMYTAQHSRAMAEDVDHDLFWLKVSSAVQARQLFYRKYYPPSENAEAIADLRSDAEPSAVSEAREHKIVATFAGPQMDANLIQFYHAIADTRPIALAPASVDLSGQCSDQVKCTLSHYITDSGALIGAVYSGEAGRGNEDAVLSLVEKLQRSFNNQNIFPSIGYQREFRNHKTFLSNKKLVEIFGTENIQEIDREICKALLPLSWEFVRRDERFSEKNFFTECIQEYENGAIIRADSIRFTIDQLTLEEANKIKYLSSFNVSPISVEFGDGVQVSREISHVLRPQNLRIFSSSANDIGEESELNLGDFHSLDGIAGTKNDPYLARCGTQRRASWYNNTHFFDSVEPMDDDVFDHLIEVGNRPAGPLLVIIDYTRGKSEGAEDFRDDSISTGRYPRFESFMGGELVWAPVWFNDLETLSLEFSEKNFSSVMSCYNQPALNAADTDHGLNLLLLLFSSRNGSGISGLIGADSNELARIKEKSVALAALVRRTAFNSDEILSEYQYEEAISILNKNLGPRGSGVVILTNRTNDAEINGDELADALERFLDNKKEQTNTIINLSLGSKDTSGNSALQEIFRSIRGVTDDDLLFNQGRYVLISISAPQYEKDVSKHTEFSNIPIQVFECESDPRTGEPGGWQLACAGVEESVVTVASYWRNSQDDKRIYASRFSHLGRAVSLFGPGVGLPFSNLVPESTLAKTAPGSVFRAKNLYTVRSGTSFSNVFVSHAARNILRFGRSPAEASSAYELSDDVAGWTAKDLKDWMRVTALPLVVPGEENTEIFFDFKEDQRGLRDAHTPSMGLTSGGALDPLLSEAAIRLKNYFIENPLPKNVRWAITSTDSHQRSRFNLSLIYFPKGSFSEDEDVANYEIQRATFARRETTGTKSEPVRVCNLSNLVRTQVVRHKNKNYLRVICDREGHLFVTSHKYHSRAQRDKFGVWKQSDAKNKVCLFDIRYFETLPLFSEKLHIDQAEFGAAVGEKVDEILSSITKVPKYERCKRRNKEREKWGKSIERLNFLLIPDNFERK